MGSVGRVWCGLKAWEGGGRWARHLELLVVDPMVLVRLKVVLPSRVSAGRGESQMDEAEEKNKRREARRVEPGRPKREWLGVEPERPNREWGAGGWAHAGDREVGRGHVGTSADEK